MEQRAVWDVFLSYSRTDLRRVEPLVAALEQAGLRVFVDHVAIPGFGAISSTIREELARSRVLLALYSSGYPHRPACQWELTAAYLAGWSEGDPRRRVLVVNPEAGSGHIHPVELRDARHWPLPLSTAELGTFAAEVADCARALPGPLPVLTPDAAVPLWSPGPRPLPSPAFTGRMADLWHLHSALNSHASPLVAETSATGAAQLHGPAGIGKTLLAQEYALRFGAAFPAGVFWLPVDRGPAGEDPVAWAFTAFEQHMRSIAQQLGIRTARLGTDAVSRAVRGALEERRGPFLWVVDGLPGRLTSAQATALCAPHPDGRTLLTARSLRYTSIATALEVLPLTRQDSHSLLTVRREPHAQAEHAAAHRLADDLGGHPLALDLLGSAAQHQSFTELLACFHTRSQSVLDTAAKDYPPATDWPGPIAATLAQDALEAGPAVLDVLRVAAALTPLGFDAEFIADAFTTAEPGSGGIALRRAKAGLGLLRTLHLVEELSEADPDGPFRVPQVLGHALERHDPDPARAQQLRLAAIRTLRTGPRTTLDGSARHPRADARRGEPLTSHQQALYSDLERMAAFDLQTELVLRIGIQQLEPDTGSLREALASLHSLFAFTRTTLRQYNIGLNATTGAQTAPSVHQLAVPLLNGTLRPFLSRWHPALAAHEALRPADVPPLHHEQAWPHASELRQSLAQLSGPMNVVVARLATISGADFGPPEATCGTTELSTPPTTGG